MSQVTGVVERINSRMVSTRYGEKEAWSVNVNGEWYSAGFNRPPCREGSQVRFDVVQKGKYFNVEGDIEVVKEQSTTAPAASSGGGGAPVSMDNRNKSITLQSAFKVAPEIVNGMIAADILTFAKNKKEASQDAYFEYVKMTAYQLQEMFLDPDTHNPLNGDKGSDEDASFEEFDDVE